MFNTNVMVKNNSTATNTFEFWASDAAGGTSGVIFSVASGTDEVHFRGDVSWDGVALGSLLRDDDDSVAMDAAVGGRAEGRCHGQR